MYRRGGVSPPEKCEMQNAECRIMEENLRFSKNKLYDCRAGACSRRKACAKLNGSPRTSTPTILHIRKACTNLIQTHNCRGRPPGRPAYNNCFSLCEKLPQFRISNFEFFREGRPLPYGISLPQGLCEIKHLIRLVHTRHLPLEGKVGFAKQKSDEVSHITIVFHHAKNYLSHRVIYCSFAEALSVRCPL